MKNTKVLTRKVIVDEIQSAIKSENPKISGKLIYDQMKSLEEQEEQMKSLEELPTVSKKKLPSVSKKKLPTVSKKKLPTVSNVEKKSVKLRQSPTDAFKPIIGKLIEYVFIMSCLMKPLISRFNISGFSQETMCRFFGSTKGSLTVPNITYNCGLDEKMGIICDGKHIYFVGGNKDYHKKAWITVQKLLARLIKTAKNPTNTEFKYFLDWIEKNSGQKRINWLKEEFTINCISSDDSIYKLKLIWDDNFQFISKKYFLNVFEDIIDINQRQYLEDIIERQSLEDINDSKELEQSIQIYNRNTYDDLLEELKHHFDSKK